MKRQRVLICCASLALVLATVSTGHSGGDKANDFPKGSEKAVAGVREAFPKAEIDAVAEPKGFGSSGGKGTPLLWSVSFHVGDKKQELSVTPEGTIIRLPITLEIKDLPEPVAKAAAAAAPGAKIKSAVKNEMRATLKYVALEKPNVQQYGIEVVKDKKRSLVTMNASGGNVQVKELKDEPIKDKGEKPGDDPKEIDIPEKAAKAVKAIKAIHPGAIVREITTEVFDDGSGTVEILTYEIEFLLKGKKHEMVASPEGIVPHLWAKVKADTLPKAVKDALDKAVPGAEIKQAQAFEFRAGLRFAALEKPRSYYTVTVEQDGKEQKLNFKPDGSAIKKVGFPKK